MGASESSPSEMDSLECFLDARGAFFAGAFFAGAWYGQLQMFGRCSTLTTLVVDAATFFTGAAFLGLGAGLEASTKPSESLSLSSRKSCEDSLSDMAKGGVEMKRRAEMRVERGCEK